jgi:hypothetical protein
MPAQAGIHFLSSRQLAGTEESFFSADARYRPGLI